MFRHRCDFVPLPADTTTNTIYYIYYIYYILYTMTSTIFYANRWLDKIRFGFVSTKKTIKYKYFTSIMLIFIFEISIRF